MKSLFEEGAEQLITARIEALRPDAPAQWGKMAAPDMVCHLVDGIRVYLGETEAKDIPGPLHWKPMRWLLAFVLPWPKGKVETAPEFLATTAGNWEADVADLKNLLREYVNRGKARNPSWGVHPAFGEMSTNEWGRLGYKHFDHHLKQFGA